MYQRILVPLDGSKLAECVLPYVEALAKGCDTQEIILVSVTERISAERPRLNRPESSARIPVIVGKKQQQADKYLHKVAGDLRAKNITVSRKVLLGNPAEQIASYAETIGSDLIIMASHGHSGPSRWTHGNVADKVFRATCVPILMVRAPGCAPGF